MSKLTQEQDKLQDRQIWEAQSLLLLWGWGPTNNRMIYKLAAMLQYAPASAPEGPCSTCGDGGQDMCSRHRPAPVGQPAQSGASEQAGMVDRAIAAARQAGLEADGFEANNLAVTATAALRVALGEALGPVHVGDADWDKGLISNLLCANEVTRYLSRRLSRLLAPAAPVERVTIRGRSPHKGIPEYWEVCLDGVKAYGFDQHERADANRYAAGLRAELADQARAAGGGKK